MWLSRRWTLQAPSALGRTQKRQIILLLPVMGSDLPMPHPGLLTIPRRRGTLHTLSLQSSSRLWLVPKPVFAGCSTSCGIYISASSWWVDIPFMRDVPAPFLLLASILQCPSGYRSWADRDKNPSTVYWELLKPARMKPSPYSHTIWLSYCPVNLGEFLQ